MILLLGNISLTACTNYRAKTGNDVSEFTHSNWITLSYYFCIHASKSPVIIINQLMIIIIIIIIYLRMIYSTCLIATFRDNGLRGKYLLLTAISQGTP